MPALSFRKVFESTEEVYDKLETPIPGYVPADPDTITSFQTAKELKAIFKRTMDCREVRRRYMIAVQEEMDWLSSLRFIGKR
jgi:hypothetical protein